MKLRAVLTILTILPLALGGAGGLQRALADSGVTVAIPANQPWTDTGLAVSVGDAVSITASGTISIAGSDPGKPPAGVPSCIAADSPTDTWVAPGLACWSMIARIGAGTALEVGAGSSFTATAGGELYLGVNDDFFGDNSGEWTAEVTVTSGSCTAAPNAPQNVTDSAPSDRGIEINWSAPQSNCATLDHYDIVSMALTGTSGSPVLAVPATATAATVTDLPLCSFFRYGVVAVGADQQQSPTAAPADPAFTQGLPNQNPVAVSIVIQGLNSSGKAGTFDPLTVDDYCTSLTGDLSSLSPDPPLATMTSQWLGLGDSHAASAGGDSNLIDALASTGGLVLPFSYTKAVLTGSASAPVFTYKAYTGTDVANSLPNDEAGVLNNEIKSIHRIWPLAKIIMVGHSNGGLVAQRWWLKYGAANPQGVTQIFTLDSPLNGVAVGKACTLLSSLCNSLGLSPALATFYQKLWNHQDRNDPKWVSLDSTSHLLTPIGTIGDPVYDAADWPATLDQAGTLSQLFYAEPSCQNSGFDLSSSDCGVESPSILDGCGPVDDGTGPDFGVPFDFWLHGVVKNCQSVIDQILQYLPGTS